MRPPHLLVLALILVAAGCSHTLSQRRTARQMRKPLHTFPSAQELDHVAASSGAPSPFDGELAALSRWELSLAPAADRALLHPLLVDALSAEGVTARESDPMGCVAHELARLTLHLDGRAPEQSLRRFIAGRCGSVDAMPRYQTWVNEVDRRASDRQVVKGWRKGLTEQLRQSLAASPGSQVGLAFARDRERVAIILAVGEPVVLLQPFSRIVGPEGTLALEGRVRHDVQGIRALVNRGRHGVAPCELDPAVAAPGFRLTCQMAADDDAAWVQLMAVRPGHVLSDSVLEVLALRDEQAARSYEARGLDEEHPLSDEDEFRRKALQLLNGVRRQAGMAELKLAPEQSRITSSVTRPFFAAQFASEEGATQMANTLTMGLMAGWSVRGGMIRGANLTATLLMDAQDPQRWLNDALSHPSGRSVLLDPDTGVLALGAALSEQPRGLAAVAVGYEFFDEDPTAGDREGRALVERLARVRKARGLGGTRLVLNAGGMGEELRQIHAGETNPGDSLQRVMERVSRQTSRPVRGFIWATQSLDAVEFPPELLRHGDLQLTVGVTHYRAPAGAWGQYAVLFVVLGAADGGSA